jgi:hypothetical protein
MMTLANYIQYRRTNGLRALELVLDNLTDQQQIQFAEEAKLHLQDLLVKKQLKTKGKKKGKPIQTHIR